MSKWSKTLLLVALTLTLSACATDDGTETPDSETPDTEEEQVTENEPEETPPEEDPEEPEENQEAEMPEFDEQIEDTISLEGMEEPITLNLYDNADAAFLTYVPEDLTAEEASGGEGEAYNFHANFVGERLEDIYLQIYMFSDQVTEQPSADDEGSTYAEALENMDPMDQTYYEWAIEEYQSPEGSRIVALGEHNEQYFMVILNSSVEYSEGFVPRANKIIEHLYWKDTGEYLMNNE